MSESAEPPLPRITVAPAGRPVTGRLHRWRQAEDGTWWAEVSVTVPATAVGQVPGEQYDNVPREAAAPTYVLQSLRHDTPAKRALVLHTAGCWAAEGRLTPVAADLARTTLRFDDTTACNICNPEP